MRLRIAVGLQDCFNEPLARFSFDFDHRKELVSSPILREPDKGFLARLFDDCEANDFKFSAREKQTNIGVCFDRSRSFRKPYANFTFDLSGCHLSPS